MIPKDVFATYSQYSEDLIIDALLNSPKRGFYVDVGANHEEYHSVTKYFYKKGWRGINIEPIPRLINEFKKTRKRDVNLGCAISSKEGELVFREYPNEDGLSTFSDIEKRINEKKGLKYEDYKVKVKNLKTVFKEYNVDDIDFLKIDVEGYEEEVLKSNDWKKYRPKIICIEANHSNGGWSKFFTKYSYGFLFYDGLNEYYATLESGISLNGFAERVALLSHSAIKNHNLKLWKHDVRHIEELRSFAANQDKKIQELQGHIEEIKSIPGMAKFLSGRLMSKAKRSKSTSGK